MFGPPPKTYLLRRALYRVPAVLQGPVLNHNQMAKDPGRKNAAGFLAALNMTLGERLRARQKPSGRNACATKSYQARSYWTGAGFFRPGFGPRGAANRDRVAARAP